MTLGTIIGRAAMVAILATGGVAAATAVALPAAAATCTATWVGPAGGDWATAGNWSPAQVPTGTSTVCVDTAGPTVAAGYAATAQQLQITGGSLRVDGRLRAATITLSSASLGGTGQLTAIGGGGNELSGVLVNGRLRISADSLLITGERGMCGGPSSLCLNGASRLAVTGLLLLQGGTVTGTTTAAPAVSASALSLAGDGQASRVAVELSAPDLTSSSSGNTLQLDHWDQLSADGTVDAGLQLGADTVTLERTVTALTTETFLAPGSLRTADGLDALRTLTTIGSGAYGRLSLPADVTPEGGTLAIASASGLTLAGPASTTVHGVLDNTAHVILATDLTADAVHSTGHFVVTDGGALTATTADFDGGLLSFNANSTVTASQGVSVAAMDGATRLNCTQFDADVTMPATGSIQLLLGAPDPACPSLYSASGSFRLPGQLVLKTKKPKAGVPVVLVDAAGGVQGTFAHIRQERGDGGDWAITYTATQVIATFHTT